MPRATTQVNYLAWSPACRGLAASVKRPSGQPTHAAKTGELLDIHWS